MREFTVVVKKEFPDRETGLIRKPGQEFKVTQKRLLEIRRSGKDYVEIKKDKAAAPAEKAKK